MLRRRVYSEFQAREKSEEPNYTIFSNWDGGLRGKRFRKFLEDDVGICRATRLESRTLMIYDM